MHASRLVVALGLALMWGTAGAQSPAPENAVPAAPVEKLKNTLRWQTNDIDSRGFDVYRSEKEEGPFEKITPRPIDGRVRGPRGDFAFVDDTIEAGKVYWYYVEVIDVLGARKKLTPVMKAPPKGVATTPKP